MRTRERILAEATEQLLAKGYPAFTVAGVRDRLGLSSGSMFHAFGSKAELAAAVYVAGMLDYQRAVLDRLDAPGIDAEQAIRAMLAAHLGWVEDHRELARFLFATLPDEVARSAEPELAQHNRTFFGALERRYRELLATADVGGDGYPVAHAICVGPAQEYCRQWVRGRVPAPPRTLTATFQDAAAAALATLIRRPLAGT
ncbi:TetR/AcrR family transcriptional regulator [Nocardia abscessus]|uniref:TetR/AcrR family transcriptional regulator n=1 Tax=Nocardia TaxID=1817 RepID=UPI001892D8C0|nr:MULTISPECIES: TetR/AcrR family transcriptional regulator [Nocardia]MBF6222299.1 TetR/AcrR family transcriptional regulator [Nocardia abscessus]MDE1671089.1 TetR/AcrR family transcriptional regulator [Nocardia gipuzkoensis]